MNAEIDHSQLCVQPRWGASTEPRPDERGNICLLSILRRTPMLQRSRVRMNAEIPPRIEPRAVPDVASTEPRPDERGNMFGGGLDAMGHVRFNGAASG